MMHSFESKLGVTSGDNFKSDAMAYEAFNRLPLIKVM
jgi:hypothetical protein